MSGELVKFLGSLLAVATLIAIAWRLKLGTDGPRIAGTAEACELADDAVCGFVAKEVALDAGGRGALISDCEGRILLLAPHGVHFAARLLNVDSRADCLGGSLSITTGERNFPPILLELGDVAEAWARRIDALDS
jgi:hypothetical protein